MTNDATTEVDLGGVPFDDDFEVEDDATLTRGGPPHDTAAMLVQRGIGYPTRAPVGIQELIRYVMHRWPGGSNRGALTVPPRAIRGGSTPSLHNWGIAWDWRWEPGPGRAAAEEVIEFMITNSTALNIQAVHDYVTGKYWKNTSGWKNADRSRGAQTGFYQPWAQWLHFERPWDAANDPTTFDQLLGGGAAPAPAKQSFTKAASAPPVAPGASAIPATEMKKGSAGADVAVLQDYLRFTGFAEFTKSDGEFGDRTEQALKKAQTRFQELAIYTAKIDGRWGPKSSAAGDEYLKRGGK